MRGLELQVPELFKLAAAQQERKARANLKLDAGRVDTVDPGPGRLLRAKELLDAADIGKLRPRREGPFKFTVSACSSPNLLHR
jgi:hypothetical protein